MSTSDTEGVEPARNTAELVRHLPRLEWRARSLLPDPAAADDLVQDTVEKALRALPRLRPGSNVGAWLERLLSNTFIDRWRRAGRQGQLVSIDVVDLAAPLDEAEPAWLEISDADLRAAVEQLPPKLGAVFRMHELGQLQYDEIGRRLGVPEGTVGTRLRRARERLRDILTAAIAAPPISIASARAAAAAAADRAAAPEAARAA